MITNNIDRNGRKMAPPSKTTIVISSLLVLLSYSHVNAEYEPGSKPPRIFKIGSNTNIENHHLILKEGMFYPRTSSEYIIKDKQVFFFGLLSF